MSPPSYIFHTPKNQLCKTFKKISAVVSKVCLYTTRNSSKIVRVATRYPLSPMLAIWLLGIIEKNINQSLQFYPSLYISYGMHFAILTVPFLTVLDKQHSNLHFTCEGASLPFLDVEVMIHEEGFDISVYRKQTFTSVLLHFNNIAPLSCKRGLITCVLHKVNLFSSNYC